MLLEQVLNTINKFNLINNKDKIVVGVSGGPDSMCLINILNYIKREKILDIDIVVAHINHMIRKEADEETEYVRNYCKNNNIECFIKKQDIARLAEEQGKGTEEIGRMIRYKFFDEIALKTESNKIATAHNANDNAETVLMNILRGTSISGLKGIEIKREEKYIRPLLESNRKDIELYCKEEKLNPKYDKTNKENIYTRNKIRNMLIPYIEENFNPNIIETVNRMSNIAEEENEYIQKQVENAYKKMMLKEQKNEIILDLKKFNQEEKVIKNRLVLYTINELLGNCQGIEKIHINDIVKLCSNNIGNKFLTPNKKIKVLVKNKQIFFTTTM